MNDNQIIELYFHRDESAIAETDRHYGMRLFRLAKKILENAEDAEEIKSDTYLKAWNSIPPERPAFFFAYLAKICRNEALNRLRFRKAKKRNMEIVELSKELEETIPAPANECLLTEKEIGACVTAFLEGYEKEKRQLFVRRYFYTESTKELAKTFGISEAKVRTDLFRMRQQLKKYLEQEGIL